MENAAKALAICAAVIFSLLVLTLLVVQYNKISSYYEEKNKMTEIEQLQEFNARFENYAGKDIRGSELVSVINRVVDYNNLQADIDYGKGYEKIIININLISNAHVNELTLDNNPTILKKKICNTAESDKDIVDLANVVIKYASDTKIKGLTDIKLQKMTAKAQDIVLDKPDEEERIYRANLLTRILGYTIKKDDNVDKIVKATKDYYQLTQFKKVWFRCDEVFYDTETGRVNGMNFIALEDDDGKLKMD